MNGQRQLLSEPNPNTEFGKAQIQTFISFKYPPILGGGNKEEKNK